MTLAHRIAVASAIFFAFAATSTANAKSHKRHHHHRHHHHRVVDRVPLVAQTHGTENGFFDRPMSGWSPGAPTSISISAGGLVAEAERHLGATGSIVGMARAWCGAYARLVLRSATGRDPGASFNLARNWARLGSPSAPVPGAVAVAPHHVGFIKAVEGNRILLVSGNHSRHVGTGWYNASRFIAFRAV